MMQQNIAIAALRSIVIDTIGDVLYFPLWWFTVGFGYIVRQRYRSIVLYADQLGLRPLLTSMFKPMFAQADYAGRVISFFLRIVIVVFQLVRFIMYTCVQIVLILLWVALPIYLFIRIGGMLGLIHFDLTELYG